MKLIFCSLLLLVIAQASALSAQGLGYADADTPSEAVGMIRVAIAQHEVMLAQCGTRYPEEKENFELKHAMWKTKEHAVITIAQIAWGETVKKDESLAKTLPLVEEGVKNNFELLSKAQRTGTFDYLLLYCTKHFSDLADGVWRKRTPRAYDFLDKRK